jgi:hypothetical protein
MDSQGQRYPKLGSGEPWSDIQLTDLQVELMQLAKEIPDPFYASCSDAIGFLRFRLAEAVRKD